MIKQRTLKNVIESTGIGLHTGEKVVLTLRPAAPNTGIVFRRVDLEEPVDIPADTDHVVDTCLGTTIAKDGARVSTIEHLMAALAGKGIDNAYIDVAAPELPVMDGSSAPFVFLIQSAGIEEQNVAKRFIRIKEKLSVSEDDKTASLEPYNGFKASLGIQYDHPFFNESNQNVCIDFSGESFINEVSRARTFGFMSDYEMLRAANLALGSGLDNTIVLDDYRALNEEGLRYPDECVRHKLLDAVGDLYLLGAGIIGEFKGYKSGHTLNHLLRQELLANQHAWEYVTFDDEAVAPVCYANPVLATN